MSTPDADALTRQAHALEDLAGKCFQDGAACPTCGIPMQCLLYDGEVVYFFYACEEGHTFDMRVMAERAAVVASIWRDAPELTPYINDATERDLTAVATYRTAQELIARRAPTSSCLDKARREALTHLLERDVTDPVWQHPVSQRLLRAAVVDRLTEEGNGNG